MEILRICISASRRTNATYLRKLPCLSPGAEDWRVNWSKDKKAWRCKLEPAFPSVPVFASSLREVIIGPAGCNHCKFTQLLHGLWAVVAVGWSYEISCAPLPCPWLRGDARACSAEVRARTTEEQQGVGAFRLALSVPGGDASPVA